MSSHVVSCRVLSAVLSSCVVDSLFSLTGSRGTGMISAEVQNDYRGKAFYRLLALDVMDGKAERVVLDGGFASEAVEAVRII